MPLQNLLAWLTGLGKWREPDAVECHELEPQELARVRRTAELAADWLCDGLIACVGNPWRRGTRQWILWETSYQAQLLQHEFANTLPGPVAPEEEEQAWETVACFA